jgi:hypothetical protein
MSRVTDFRVEDIIAGHDSVSGELLALDLRDARRALALAEPVLKAAEAWRAHPGSGNPDSEVAHTAWTDETRALMRAIDQWKEART